LLDTKKERTMTNMPASQARGHYFVPAESNYSTFLSAGIFLLALGFIFRLNGVPPACGAMLAGHGGDHLCGGGLVWRADQREPAWCLHFQWEDRSYRIGMVWFIFSEVMFFACFFGVLYYIRRISLPELARYEAMSLHTLMPVSPALGPAPARMGEVRFTPMHAWGIPAINTCCCC
jgi:cytochrome c oxidase subunit 3